MSNFNESINFMVLEEEKKSEFKSAKKRNQFYIFGKTI